MSYLNFFSILQISCCSLSFGIFKIAKVISSSAAIMTLSFNGLAKINLCENLPAAASIISLSGIMPPLFIFFRFPTRIFLIHLAAKQFPPEINFLYGIFSLLFQNTWQNALWFALHLAVLAFCLL